MLTTTSILPAARSQDAWYPQWISGSGPQDPMQPPCSPLFSKCSQTICSIPSHKFCLPSSYSLFFCNQNNICLSPSAPFPSSPWFDTSRGLWLQMEVFQAVACPSPGPGVRTPLKDEGALSTGTKDQFPSMKHQFPHNSACSTMYSLKIILLGRKVEAKWESSSSIRSVTP